VTALVARVAFDELILYYLLMSGHAMRAVAVDAVAPNRPPPPEDHRPVSEEKSI